MRRVRKFFALSRAEQHVLGTATVVLAAVRVGLWLFPFRIVRPVLERIASGLRGLGGADEETVDRIAWAVSTAARYVPRATCLTQALALQVLLAHRGELSRLHIGVRRDQHLGVKAHAWLENRGRVVIGGSSVGSFIPLSLLDEPR